MTKSTNIPAPANRNWNRQKSILNEKNSIISNADLHYERVKKDEIINKIPVILSKNNGILASIISAL